jgi:hypothetical protein
MGTSRAVFVEVVLFLVVVVAVAAAVPVTDDGTVVAFTKCAAAVVLASFFAAVVLVETANVFEGAPLSVVTDTYCTDSMSGSLASFARTASSSTLRATSVAPSRQLLSKTCTASQRAA